MYNKGRITSHVKSVQFPTRQSRINLGEHLSVIAE